MLTVLKWEQDMHMLASILQKNAKKLKVNSMVNILMESKSLLRSHKKKSDARPEVLELRTSVTIAVREVIGLTNVRKLNGKEDVTIVEKKVIWERIVLDRLIPAKWADLRDTKDLQETGAVIEGIGVGQATALVHQDLEVTTADGGAVDLLEGMKNHAEDIALVQAIPAQDRGVIHLEVIEGTEGLIEETEGGTKVTAVIQNIKKKVATSQAMAVGVHPVQGVLKAATTIQKATKVKTPKQGNFVLRLSAVLKYIENFFEFTNFFD